MQTTILNFITMSEGSPRGLYCKHIKKGFLRKGLTFYQTRKLWTELKLKVISDDKKNVLQLVICFDMVENDVGKGENACILPFSFSFFLIRTNLLPVLHLQTCKELVAGRCGKNNKQTYPTRRSSIYLYRDGMQRNSPTKLREISSCVIAETLQPR